MNVTAHLYVMTRLIMYLAPTPTPFGVANIFLLISVNPNCFASHSYESVDINISFLDSHVDIWNQS